MDERDWTDRPLEIGARIETPDCTVTRREVGELSLISGDLRAALAVLAPQAALLGFGETPEGPDFALRIGRDQALLVTNAALPVAAGWHAGGFALSPAGQGLARLDLTGPGAADLLAHGLAAPAPWTSPSAAILFCGHRVLVSGLPDGLSLWVEQGRLTSCCSFLAADIG